MHFHIVRFAYTPAYPLLIHRAGTNKLHSLLECLGNPAQFKVLLASVHVQYYTRERILT